MEIEIDVQQTTATTTTPWKRKGRGHRTAVEETRPSERGTFERVEEGTSSGPVKSVEGWVLLVTNVHEEAQEDDILDKFGEFGQVNNIHVNLDRRTGFVKGYALVEYGERAEAEAAIAEMNQQDMLGQPITVDWAFRKTGSSARRRRS